MKKDSLPDQLAATITLGMKRKKIFVDAQGRAEFPCDVCGDMMLIEPERYKDAKGPIRVRRTCRCGATTRALLERRIHYRKDTRLPGLYRVENETDPRPMLVENLSCMGMKMAVKGQPLLQIGQRLIVSFSLGDERDPHLEQTAVIRNRNGNRYGLAFDPAPSEDAVSCEIRNFLCGA